jgi:hypothetical protein
MSTKAERFPMWRFRRLSSEQKAALDRLCWYSPGAAERARLKKVLGWRRSRQETVALAEELLDEGRMLSAVADELAVGTRYLTRLLKSPTPRKRPCNASNHTAKVATTCETDTGVPLNPETGDVAR